MKFLNNLSIRLIYSLFIIIIWLGGNCQIIQGAKTAAMTHQSSDALVNQQLVDNFQQQQQILKTMQIDKPIIQPRDGPRDGVNYPIGTGLTLSADGETATVSNGEGLLQALWDIPKFKFTGSTFDSSDFQGRQSNAFSKIHTIKVTQNISLPDENISDFFKINTKNTEDRFWLSFHFIYLTHDHLTIDLQGHTLNTGFNDFALSGNTQNTYKEDWTFKNGTIYTSTFWGIVSPNTGNSPNIDLYPNGAPGSDNSWTRITFDNISFFGSQLSHGYGIPRLVFKGNCDIHSVPYYQYGNKVYWSESWGNDINAVDRPNYPVAGSGERYNPGKINDQQNIETGDVVFSENCHYYGETSGGNCIQVTGGGLGVEFQKNATVDLYPHTYHAEGSPVGDTGFGVLITDKNGIVMDENAKLNIHCYNNSDLTIGNDPQDPTKKIKIPLPRWLRSCSPAVYLNSGGYIKYRDKSASINIDTNGPIGNNNTTNYPVSYHPLVYLNGDVTLTHGSFRIAGQNLGDYQSGDGLVNINSTSNIKISKKGDFSVSINDNKTTSTGPISLIKANGPLNILLDNPGNVSLDARGNNNPNTNIVTAGNGGSVKAYDTKLEASGVAPDNQTPVTLNPVKLQKINIPFNGSTIDIGNLFGQSPIPIGSTESGLSDLASKLMAMSLGSTAKEFNYLKFSGLSGPYIDTQFTNNYQQSNQTPVIYPDQPIIKHLINDADDPSQGAATFQPLPPLLTLALKKNLSTSTIDLANTQTAGTARWWSSLPGASAFQIRSFSNSSFSKPEMILPNQIDGEGELQLPGDYPSAANPLLNYLNVPDFSTSYPQTQVWDSTNTNLSLNMTDFIKYYNEKTGSNIKLASGDKILLSAVSNFQHSPTITTDIDNLLLGLTNTNPHTYLLGEKLNVPVQYQDADTAATKIDLTGNAYNSSNAKINSSAYKQTISESNGKKGNFNWIIPGLTSNTGDYQFKFSGQNDANGKYPWLDTDLPVTYNYHVANLPAYTGTISMTGVSNTNTVTQAVHKTTTSFVPQGSAPLNYVQYDPGALANAVDFSNDRYFAQITASCPGHPDATIKLNSDPQHKYQAQEFWPGLTQFPANTTFTITSYVKVTGQPHQLVTLGPAKLLSSDDSNVNYTLGTSNTFQATIEPGTLSLTVPSKMDFGKVMVNLQKTQVPIAKLTGALQITNSDNQAHHANLAANISSLTPNNPLTNIQAPFYLIYKTSSNQTLTGTSLINMFDGNVPTSGLNLSQNWYSYADGSAEQTAGFFLDFPKSSADLQKLPISQTQYQATIDWVLTEGPD